MRYIDADELLNRLPNDLPYKASVKRVLIQAPEANMMPKGEVAELLTNLRKSTTHLQKTIAENAQKSLEVTLEEIEKAKAEVAREIFEEIEKHMVIFGDTSLSTYFRGIGWKVFAELKKKYTEEK